ncbi:MAG: DUF2934 domain-containing protein [Acidobacteria bacterium]|nr:DUF2934 domain-containing protein [Acidobacteriota bacterium]
MPTVREKNRAPVRRKPASSPGSREWGEEQRRQIAERAYHLFIERGGQHGYELDDWLRAEAELAASLKKPRARRIQKAAGA